MGQDVSKPATADADSDPVVTTSKYNPKWRLFLISKYTRDVVAQYKSLANIPQGIQQIIVKYYDDVISIEHLSSPPDGYRDTSFSQFKILIGGSNRINGGVGKTALLTRYMDDTFHDTYQFSIGIDFRFAFININNEFSRLQMWDLTRGRERFRSISPMYYRGTQGVFVVFSLTDRKSFEYTEQHMKEMKVFATENIYGILIGNKSDLKDQRAVTYDEANKFADKWDMKYIETSAKTGENVKDAFEMMIKEVYKMNINNPKCQRKSSIKLKTKSSAVKSNETSLYHNCVVL